MKSVTAAHRCRIPLTSPLVFRGVTVEHRDVVLLSDDNGRWAEAAPLPGFSHESVDDVLAAFNDPQADYSTCPSLQFACDCLNQSDWPSTAVSVPINALLTGSVDEFSDRARALANSKCRAVKLKVGSVTLDEDIHRVRQLRAILRSDQTIRLDANRAWDFKTAVAFAESVSQLDSIEYIEEPLKDPSRLEPFFAETKFSFALDETLLDDVRLESFPSAAAFVVKPTLIGSIDRIQTLAELGKPLVFSGCFESGVGTLQVARLAATYSPNIPAGLDTYSRIGSDVLTEPLQMDDWTLRIDGPPAINDNKIAEFSR